MYLKKSKDVIKNVCYLAVEGGLAVVKATEIASTNTFLIYQDYVDEDERKAAEKFLDKS